MLKIEGNEDLYGKYIACVFDLVSLGSLINIHTHVIPAGLIVYSFPNLSYMLGLVITGTVFKYFI